MQDLIGKIFYTSWGYDQTNYDFIKVIGLTKSGKSAICQRCYANTIDEESTISTYALQPNGKTFGDKFKMKIGKSSYNCENTLRGSFPYCCDGSMKNKMLATFWECSPKEVYQETRLEYGH